MGRKGRAAAAVAAGVAVVVSGLSVPAHAGVAEPPRTERVSVSTSGQQAAAFTASRALSLSADGRFVTFASTAPNLVPGDTNGVTDVFVRDRLLGTTERVSVSTSGQQGNGPSGDWGMNLGNNPPSISGDGRYVVFESQATNLAPTDINGSVWDIHIHDRVTRQTGIFAYYGRNSQISADGRYITWEWEGTVSRRERTGGDHRTVIQGADTPVISGNGRFVAFQSQNGWVAGDTNGSFDVFVRDLDTGILERASVSSQGTEGSGHSFKPSLSYDGRFVAFQSGAPLVPQDTSCCSTDIFVRDRLAGTTERANVSSGGAEANSESGMPRISADGRFVAFESWASNLTPGDTGNSLDVFLRDRVAATTEMMSVSTGGVPGGGYAPAVSADGRVVAFSSLGGDLVPGDTNAWEDAFVRDLGRRHQCDDGLDNDGDGRVDAGDVGCGAHDDDDEGDEPSASISGVGVAEGDGQAVFRVNLSAPAAYEVEIDWATADREAQAGQDYVAARGTLSIPAGLVTGEIPIAVEDDIVDEGDETFTLLVSNARNALLAAEQATATIVDDDTSMISISDTAVVEGDTGTSPAVFTVWLSTPSAQTVEVDVTTGDGTATAPGDYAPTATSVTFAPGEIVQGVAVAVAGDVIDEPAEAFDALLSAARGAAVHDRTGTATIVDDDRNGSFSCRASALRAAGVEPAVANLGQYPCTDGHASALAAGELGGLPITVIGLHARTAQEPDDQAGTDPTAGDGGAAEASVAWARIGNGPQAVMLWGLEARGRAACAVDAGGLTAVVSGSSRVGAIQIGDALPVAVGDATLDVPLAGGAVLHLNHEIVENGSVVRRAAWIESAAGDLVIAEARAGILRDPCSG